ncbi:MAG TPA: hypothetical protein VID72_11815 [Ktedonobacterales bacterium]
MRRRRVALAALLLTLLAGSTGYVTYGLHAYARYGPPTRTTRRPATR